MIAADPRLGSEGRVAEERPLARTNRERCGPTVGGLLVDEESPGKTFAARQRQRTEVDSERNPEFATRRHAGRSSSFELPVQADGFVADDHRMPVFVQEQEPVQLPVCDFMAEREVIATEQIRKAIRIQRVVDQNVLPRKPDRTMNATTKLALEIREPKRQRQHRRLRVRPGRRHRRRGPRTLQRLRPAVGRTDLPGDRRRLGPSVLRPLLVRLVSRLRRDRPGLQLR